MSAHKIEKKITGYKVVTDQPPVVEPVVDFVKQHMNESVMRPDVLVGSTYKIKTPSSEHALYITINDIILNQGTDHEERRPYEIFINSKNMEHFQWSLALTRLISAVFRKGGDVAFLAEELQNVFDPKGGYFHRGKFKPSLVAEIGEVIERHLIDCGLIRREVDEHQQRFLADKKAELERKMADAEAAGFKVDRESSQFPEHAVLCAKCNHKAMVIMDGCMTCLNCGDSKCG